MWAVTNRSPFAVGRNWLRDKKGEHHRLVAARATFEIRDGGRLALEDDATVVKEKVHER
jgi:hypothetical protein